MKLGHNRELFLGRDSFYGADHMPPIPMASGRVLGLVVEQGCAAAASGFGQASAASAGLGWASPSAWGVGEGH